MKAIGEHVVIRKPERQDKQGGLIMPDSMDIEYSYGKVKSVGPLVEREIGMKIEEGDLVLFDPNGVRELELGAKSTKGGELVVAHASMLFTTIAAEQLESRKLPLPK